MNKIIIISSYPSTKCDEEILIKTIDSLTNIGYKTMLVSHLPISVDIQKKVNYFLYDFENTMIPSLSYFWFCTQNFKVTVNNIGHMVAICKNMINGIGMAKNLGFDYFFYTESDNIISHLDQHSFDDLLNQMISEDKKMIFHKFNNGDTFGYNTILFGGCTEYFANNINLPKNTEEYYKYNISGILEYDFYNHLNKEESKFLIKHCEGNILEGFENSEINKISNIDVICEVLNTNQGYFLYLMNNTKNNIEFNINGSLIGLQSGSYWFNKAEYETNVIINDGELKRDKIFILTEENKNYYNNKGYIEFF